VGRVRANSMQCHHQRVCLHHCMSACMPTVIYSKSYSKKIICLQTWDSNYIIWTNAIIMPYENITIRSQILLASLDIKICQVSAWEILTKIFVTSQLEHVVRFKVLTKGNKKIKMVWKARKARERTFR